VAGAALHHARLREATLNLFADHFTPSLGEDAPRVIAAILRIRLNDKI
jgi:hypothetical protein